MDRQRARKHYDEAERLRGQGEAAQALAELERAVEADPDTPNAHNLAGWLLSSALRGTPDAAARALRHFEEAHARFPDDHVALANLADALVAAGQGERAVGVVEAALARTPGAARPHNWLGWHHLTRTGDVERAVAHLEKATLRGGWWGPAHQNHGAALEAKGDLAAAYEAYRCALVSGDAHDIPFVYARMGAFQRAWGRPRRALSLFRRALRHERARRGAREAEIEGAARALEEALLARPAYFPHAGEEQAWIEAEIAGKREGIGLEAREGVVPFRAFRERAASALAALGGDPHGRAAARVVRRMLDAARDQKLAAELAGERFALDPAPLGAAARERLEGVVAAWPRLHLLLYTQLLEREEPDRPAGPADTLGALVDAGRHDEALAALGELKAKGDWDALLACVGLAERAGDDAALGDYRARARDYYAHALDAYRVYASWSTSGGEGLARMVDVRRLEQKVAGARDG